jgi:hypothetical protein
MMSKTEQNEETSYEVSFLLQGKCKHSLNNGYEKWTEGRGAWYNFAEMAWNIARRQKNGSFKREKRV